MKNFVQPGKALNLTAPTGGVTGGTPVKIGALLVIPSADADQTKTFAGHTTGVYTLPKKTGETWAEGDKLYWDNSAGTFTKTSATGLFPAGVAAEIQATSGATTGVVRLDGVSLTAVPA